MSGLEGRVGRAGARAEVVGRQGARAAYGPAGLREWLETTSPGWAWDPPHLRLIQERLERMTRGELRRLMVFVPPRHGKSELATIRYPIYRLERDPALRVIVAAHTQMLADHFSRLARRIARERLALSDERSAAQEWQTTAGGGVQAVGVGTGVTGRGAGLIAIDDPVRGREEAQSERLRERVYEWYRSDLFTRGEPDCPILLIQTRWHEEDLAGKILASEDGARWEVVRIPALAETQEDRDEWARKHGRPTGEPDPLGRAPGEPIWPERYSLAELEMRRRVLGESGFASLFQQTPYPAGGGMFRREWFLTVEEAPPIRCVRFWDCGSKAGPRNSYTCGALLGRTATGKWYLKHLVRGRWEYPDAKNVILSTALTDGRSVPVGIEDTANGTALVQDLRRDPRASGVRLTPIKPVGDKVVRAGAWASLAQGGLFHLAAGGWNEAFLDEAQAFPYGAYDDQIDAVSGAHGMLVQHLYLLSGFTEDEKLRLKRLGPAGPVVRWPKRF